jgi:uncharacterized protein HemX
MIKMRETMSTTNSRKNHKKHVPALIAAFGMTAVVGVLMLGLGVNALLNKNVATAQAAKSTDSLTLDTATPEELKTLIAEYQLRETQYQQELSQAVDQINQANGQIQQYQAFIMELQNAGVIRINRNGQVTVMTGMVGSNVNNEGFRSGDD